MCCPYSNRPSICSYSYNSKLNDHIVHIEFYIFLLILIINTETSKQVTIWPPTFLLMYIVQRRQAKSIISFKICFLRIINKKIQKMKISIIKFSHFNSVTFDNVSVKITRYCCVSIRK